MKLTKKIRRGAVSLAAALYTAYLMGISAFAEGTTSAVSQAPKTASSGVENTFTKVVNFITPIAWSLVAVVLVVMGIILIAGGDKAKEKVKAHAALLIIGCVLVAGATVFANWLKTSIGKGF